jgi:hypothetical protein
MLKKISIQMNTTLINNIKTEEYLSTIILYIGPGIPLIMAEAFR